MFPLFILRIVPDKFKVGNRFDSDALVIRAIIKVQSNKDVNLTDAKAGKLKPWKLVSAGKGGDEDKQSDDDEPILSVLEQMNRDRKRQADMAESDLHKSAYDPAIKHCVLGSAAEVERVWSMAGHVLTEHRSSTRPWLARGGGSCLVLAADVGKRAPDACWQVGMQSSADESAPVLAGRLEA